MGTIRVSKGMVWCGVAWHGVAWHGVAWRGVAWYGLVWHGMGEKDRTVQVLWTEAHLKKWEEVSGLRC